MKKITAPRIVLLAISTVRAILIVAYGPLLSCQERITRLIGWASLPICHPVGRQVLCNAALPLAVSAFAPALFLLGAKKTAVLVAFFAFTVCLAVVVGLTFQLVVITTTGRKL